MMDLDHANRQLMAALDGIAEGKGLSDSVYVQPWGQTIKIFNALNDAKHLTEPFHAEELATVDRAFKKLGLLRTSNQKSVAANVILKKLTKVD
jgi:hypothetical protein